MIRHPNEENFHFYFEDDTVHYHVPALTNQHLYGALLELGLANSILDIMKISQNNPQKRLIAAFRYARQLLSEVPGLCSADKESLSEVQRLIEYCDSTDVLKESSEIDFSICLVDAANRITDIMQRTFFSKEQKEEIFGDALMEHVMLQRNPEFKKLMDSIN